LQCPGGANWTRIEPSGIKQSVNSRHDGAPTQEVSKKFDVLIVGAGLSGIGAAFHIQNKCPNFTYAVLEGRARMGGTWDLFRYPGVRSDSDMHTLGYSFRPWTDPRAIADGPAILRYIEETAKEFGIDSQIRFSHRVVSCDWSSADALWRVSVLRADTSEELTLSCRFLILCAGYYDYEKGYTPDYPGVSAFRGEFVHPQFWNEAIDYSDRRVIVIGSGATAVTLVPELAKRAKEVIMLQRSPSYIASIPSVDSVAAFLKKFFPSRLAHRIVRWKNILLTMAFFHFCRRFPKAARRHLLGGVSKALSREQEPLKNFSPNYDPWDQRLCFVPDGDFFQAVNSGKAKVVTGTIETFTESGVRLSSGEVLSADIIISATGLRIKFLGGASFRIDGQPVDVAKCIPYKGAMLSGVPNFGMAFGYTNASWTLKCDLICEWLSRLFHYVDANGYSAVTPDEKPLTERIPLIDFSSGYFQRAKEILPGQGKRSPWKVHQNYFLDLISFRARPLADRGLKFTR
jgi:monooxygenase